MRGKILQYNGNEGQGVIVADGNQYGFRIASWKGDIVPAVGKAVEVTLADGQLQSVAVVPDDVIMREKTAELTGKIGAIVGDLGSGLAKAGAGTAGGSIVTFYGRNLLIAYGVFLLGTIFLNAISLNFFGTSQGQPLFELASMLNQFGVLKGLKAGLLLSYAGFAVPYFWRDRRGWLLLALPLLVVLYAIWSGVRTIGAGGGGDGPGIFDLLGLGAYLSLLSGLVLAGGGLKRFLATS